MRLILIFAATAALGACDRPGPVAKNMENTSTLPDPLKQSSGSPSGGPPANAVATVPAGGSASPIPAALQGRWGLTPGDCIGGNESEGRLSISGNELRFYESVATPAANVHTSENSVGGNFDFIGEGQEWTKYQSLRLRGAKLVRTERDPIASYNYVRCD